MSTPTARYQLKQLLDGLSPIAQQYQASQTGLDRIVEIRLSKQVLPEGSEEQQRWKLILKTLATIDHPCFIKVLDTGTIKDRPYFVIQLRKSACFRTLSNEGLGLSHKKVLTIGQKLANALGQLHARGLLLRDLSCETVHYDKEKDLTYLGLYHGLIPTDKSSSLSEQDQKILSPSFLLTPEAVNKLPLSPQTDFFMLAALLYELVTGRNPLTKEMLYRNNGVTPSWEFPLASEIVPGLPGPLSTFLASVLKEKPEDRPRDAEDFCNLVQRTIQRLDVADQLSRSVAAARQATTIDISKSMARKKERKAANSAKKTPEFSLSDTLKELGANPKLQLMGMLIIPIFLIGGVFYGLVSSGGSSTASENAKTTSGRKTATRGPRPPKARIPKSRNSLKKLAKEVEALSNVIATSTTGKKNFLKRWNLLKRWIILVPVPERKKHLFSYAKIVNTKILYFSSAPKACKELDAYIEKAGRYLRLRE